MTNYEKEYSELLRDILRKPEVPYKDNRTESRTMMSFGKSITANLAEGFPVLSGRKMFPKTFFTELKWFTNGETNIQRFKDAGVKIWNKWADKNGDLGPVYGHQLRNFNGNDQLLNVLTLLGTDPTSRRMVVNLWNPSDLPDMALPPCYHTFTFSVVNDRLNIDVTMRSCDVFVGLPYDMAMFSAMNHLMCEGFNLSPGKVRINMTDAHVYWDNVSSANAYMESIDLAIHTKLKFDVPQLYVKGRKNILNFQPEDLELKNYSPNSHIKVEVVL
jgi:thymidylate synthase